MFCTQCGSHLSDDCMFCTNCGADLNSILSDTPIQPADSPIPNTDSFYVPTKRRKTGLISMLVALFVCVLGTTLFISLGGDEKVKSTWQVNAGNRYLEALDYENAIAAYQEAIDIDPKLEVAYIGLAKAYEATENYEKALDVLSQGIRETNSDNLIEYRVYIEEKWLDSIRLLSGHVYKVDTDLDDNNNEALNGVTVSLTNSKGKKLTYTTDSNGRYKTDLLKKDTYDVSFSLDGFVSYSTSLKLEEGKESLDVYIEPLIYSSLLGNIYIADADTDYTNNQVLSDANISLKKINASNDFHAETTTNSDGFYQLDDLLIGVYEMTISKEGYITVTQNVTIYEGQTSTYNVLIEMISENMDGEGTASGTIYDALTGEGVSDLALSIRSGLNNTDGRALASCSTDSYGYYTTPSLPSGNYCITVEDPNTRGAETSYNSTTINIKILGNCNIDNQDGTVSNQLLSGQVRIVLSWGEQPYDLDSHMEAELDNGSSFHIYYDEPEGYAPTDNSETPSASEMIANLDLDDTSSYGPETTTIYRNEPGIYSFFVHNFSRDYDYSLANSRACVQVYLDYNTAPSYVFYVPYGAGYYWDVFNYDTTTGILSPINTLHY